jgi:hypothetical protein
MCDAFYQNTGFTVPCGDCLADPFTTEADERYQRQQAYHTHQLKERIAKDNVFRAMTLAEYLAFRNKQAEDAMAADPGLWCSLYHTDIAEWNRSGIFTSQDMMNMEDGEDAKEQRKMAYG